MPALRIQVLEHTLHFRDMKRTDNVAYFPEVEPRRRRRQRAEWERADDDADDDIDSACSSDAEFDERAFLRGRVATVRRSVERDSSVESGDRMQENKKTFV